MYTKTEKLTVLLVLAWSLATFLPVQAQEFEREPIEYSKRSGENRVTQLMAELQTGKKTLKHEPENGYLRSLLADLQVPESSQTLVFSKTSLQRQRISPATPRALYFSDDTYVGFCQDGEVLEVSAMDKDLGAMFYTLDQTDHKTPRITRQADNCLICHASSSTKGVPGYVVRSVYSDAGGFPILSSGTHRTDHTSPLIERWGGWYVTGTHGNQKHLGNLVVRGKQEPEQVDNAAGQNVTDLSQHFDSSRYLTPHSDVVALMVLEHQAEAHNYIVHANFATRQALHYEQTLNRELGKPPEEHWDSTRSRIKSACEPLVEYLLFCDETPLTHKIEGTSRFAEEFQEQGPRDKRGRSLRDFDLTRRMFKYPCSYLVYSPSFSALPKEAKDYVFRRLREVLSGPDPSDSFKHLSADDRQALQEILAETLPGYRT
ncbi:MAG: hypothetical protein IAF94_05205 [Pirellulaceae bacterium]|nr:hypothetical protein [Pirellulaceae bacterium]